MSQEKPLAEGSRPRPEGLPKEARLRKRPAFTNVYRTGRKLQGRRFVVFGVAAATRGVRLGITTTKKIGNAAVRNRLRRQVREIYRRWRAAQKVHDSGLELVVNVTEQARGASFAALCEELEPLLSRAAGARS